jgi:hypothetical protein
VRHASDYHAKGRPDLVALAYEVDMVVSDESYARCFIHFFGMYVYPVFLELEYWVCMGMVYKVQQVGVYLCRLKLRVSENQIKA